MMDLILQGGDVVDGSGAPRLRADVGLLGDRIVAVGDLATAPARRRLSIAGKVVAPGFIDIHSHSDMTLLENPLAHSKVRQGVTTEVVGNCGFSLAPIVGKRRGELWEYLQNTVVMSSEAWSRCRWESTAQFCDDLISGGISVNIAPLVGYGTVRVGVMGLTARPADPREIVAIRRAVHEEMLSGAFGVSLGLEYPPNAWADHMEMAAVAKTVAASGGIMAVHMRNEGDGLVDSIDEVLAVSRDSGVSLQVSHLKAERAQNHGKVRLALDTLRTARRSGMRVDADVYPYVAYGSNLVDLVPPWTRVDGMTGMLAILRDPSGRARVALQMATGADGWPPFMRGLTFADVRIASLRYERNRSHLGQSIAEVARERGVEPDQAVIDLLLEEDAGIKMVVFGMAEDDVSYLLGQPDMIIGSDGRAVQPEGPLGATHCHPRYYGTFPRVLGRYVRDERVLSLESAIRQMTSLPAEKLGLHDRGAVRAGAVGDLVVFDPRVVADVATYEIPHRYPVGIEQVLVAGQFVVADGEHTGATPGRALRHSRAGTGGA